MIDDHVVSVEPRRYTPLQWVSAWALLGPVVDALFVDQLNAMDVVVRERDTNVCRYRCGPLYGEEANQLAEHAFSSIRRFGLGVFLADSGTVST